MVNGDCGTQSPPASRTGGAAARGADHIMPTFPGQPQNWDQGPKTTASPSATIGCMKSSRVVKLLGEFLGFLLVSTGGTLIAIGILLVLSRIGLGDGDPGSVVRWVNLVLGSGGFGIAMVAAGVFLVRRLKR